MGVSSLQARLCSYVALQEDFAMGAAAGAFAAAATTPLDVIKTNMMCTAASRPTMVSSARTVLTQGGPASFFRWVSSVNNQELLLQVCVLRYQPKGPSSGGRLALTLTAERHMFQFMSTGRLFTVCGCLCKVSGNTASISALSWEPVSALENHAMLIKAGRPAHVLIHRERRTLGVTI